MRTQKAKGILLGTHEILQKYHRLCKFFAPMGHRLISHQSQLKAFNSKDFPIFGRPCPVRPRHGFVDSQVVSNKQQLERLWTDAQSHDFKSEVILGPYMDKVDYNGIYVSSGNLSIGVGNDGATGGKKSISFPVAPTKFTKKLKRMSGVKDNNELYLESIMQDGWWYLAQVRGGPAINATNPDYVPQKVKVNHVIFPHNNLVRWEEEMSMMKHKPGVVVYGKGHTLASHAAIHCVLNNIPFITTRRPQVGEVFEPTNNSEAPKLNRNRLREGVWAADKMFLCLDDTKDIEDKLQKHFYFALSVLHNWAYMKNSTEADWLLGAASQSLVRICSALCFGEHRHMYQGGGGLFKEKGRSKVYVKALNCEIDFLNSLSQVFKDFYSQEWSGGFGGPPWATCSWYTLALWNRVVRTNNANTSTLSESEVADIIGTVNKLVNLAHNNGWWFNKFTTKRDFDFIAKEPGLASFAVAEVFYQIHRAIRNSGGTTYINIKPPKKVISPAGRDKDGRLVWVSSYHRISDEGGLSNFFFFREDGKKRHVKRCKVGKEAVDAINDLRSKKKLPVNAMHALKVRDGKVSIPGKKEPVRISSLFRKKKKAG